MEDGPTIRNFLRAFGDQWFTRMSGPLTVPFAIAALVVPGTILKLLFAILAIISGLFASYGVWAKERLAVLKAKEDVVTVKNDVLKTQERLKEEIEKRGHPEIVITQCMGGNDYNGQLAFSITNDSVPAINLRVDDISYGGKTINFPCYPSSLAGSQQNLIGSIVGFTGAFAIGIQRLFEEQRPESVDTSETLQFAIRYTDTEGKNEWATFARFRYDYREQLFVLLKQWIDKTTSARLS